MDKRAFVVLLALLMFSGTTFATTIHDPFDSLCTSLTQTLPIVAVALLLLAGIIYVAGRKKDAKMRKKTNLLAAVIFLGGILTLLIAAATPYIIWLMAVTFTGTPLSSISPNCYHPLF